MDLFVSLWYIAFLSFLFCFFVFIFYLFIYLFIYFLFFIHWVLDHGSYKFYCRSWTRYPSGCFVMQVLNWVHWVLPTPPPLFLVPVHELDKSPFVKCWARYPEHLLLPMILNHAFETICETFGTICEMGPGSCVKRYLFFLSWPRYPPSILSKFGLCNI